MFRLQDTTALALYCEALSCDVSVLVAALDAHANVNCSLGNRYPITLADFFLADVTDAMLDGYIAGFPNTYASKVGKVRGSRLRFVVDVRRAADNRLDVQRYAYTI